jgi:hypothetical protein
MSLEKLSDGRVESALIYLSSTDEEHAELSGEVKRLEELLNRPRATHFYYLAVR